MCLPVPQYSVAVVKYDRNGFRPRLRQLILTQEAAYLVEEAKIKQRIDYISLKGQMSIIIIWTEIDTRAWNLLLQQVYFCNYRCLSQQPEWQLPDPSCYMWWHEEKGRPTNRLVSIHNILWDLNQHRSDSSVSLKSCTSQRDWDHSFMCKATSGLTYLELDRYPTSISVHLHLRLEKQSFKFILDKLRTRSDRKRYLLNLFLQGLKMIQSPHLTV